MRRKIRPMAYSLVLPDLSGPRKTLTLFRNYLLRLSTLCWSTSTGILKTETESCKYLLPTAFVISLTRHIPIQVPIFHFNWLAWAPLQYYFLICSHDQLPRQGNHRSPNIWDFNWVACISPPPHMFAKQWFNKPTREKNQNQKHQIPNTSGVDSTWPWPRLSFQKKKISWHRASEIDIISLLSGFTHTVHTSLLLLCTHRKFFSVLLFIIVTPVPRACRAHKWKCHSLIPIAEAWRHIFNLLWESLRHFIQLEHSGQAWDNHAARHHTSHVPLEVPLINKLSPKTLRYTLFEVMRHYFRLTGKIYHCVCLHVVVQTSWIISQTLACSKFRPVKTGIIRDRESTLQSR